MDSFLAQLTEKFQTLPREEGALSSLRHKAWQRFLELGLPHRKQEAFQDVPLSQLYSRELRKDSINMPFQEALKKFIHPECSESLFVFVDGAFRPDLSNTAGFPKQVIFSSLSTAMLSYGNILQQRFSKSFAEEKDPFVLFNLAAHEKGLFVYIPPRTILSAPIQVLHLLTRDASPRLHVFAGAGSEVRWITKTAVLTEEPIWFNGVIDLALEEGACFQHVEIVEKSEIWHQQAFRGTLKRDSRLKSIHLAAGVKTLRSDYRMALLGENAEAQLQGIWMLDGRSESHTHVLMEHIAPHTRSTQCFKGVLQDSSKSSFAGKIFVHQKAQKTEAYQLNNNLLLGERALATAKPNLEIFADDVKASHGATMGQLDPQQLFYLKTRGIPEAAAKRLLILGFCRQIIDQIPYPSVREAIDQLLQKSL